MQGRTCRMRQVQVEAKDEVDVLGIKLEQKISGEAHAEAAASKADKVMWQIHRTAKYMSDAAHIHHECLRRMLWAQSAADEVQPILATLIPHALARMRTRPHRSMSIDVPARFFLSEVDAAGRHGRGEGENRHLRHME